MDKTQANKETQIKKQSANTDEWMKCRSKSWPTNFYLFNKLTGETKWCTNSESCSSVIDDKKMHQHGIALKVEKKSTTPAQDRLKRLQRLLKKDNTYTVQPGRQGPETSAQTRSCRVKNTPAQDYPDRNSRAPNSSKTKLTIVKPKTKGKEVCESDSTDETEQSTPQYSDQNLTHGNVKESVLQEFYQHNLGIFKSAKTICKRIQKNTSNALGALKHSLSIKNLKVFQTKQVPIVYNPIRCLQDQNNSTTAQAIAVKIVNCYSSDPTINRETPNSLLPTSIEQIFELNCANKRLERFQQSLQQTLVHPPPRVPGDVFSSEFEPMDWQHSEFRDNQISSSEVMLSEERYSFPKCQISAAAATIEPKTMSEYYDNVNENILRLSAERAQNRTMHPRWLKNHYYFVVDTNVFLRDLTFIEELRNMILCDTKGSVIYVPYIVLQELDRLKMREPTITLAARAIQYLNSKFESKNSRLQAQSACDERKYVIDVSTPDDSIINCCLQGLPHVDHLILLTEDVNLRNKALCNNLIVTTKSDLISDSTGL